MPATDREAYAAASERLAAYAAGADPDAVVTVADEVLAVAGILRRQHRLRRGRPAPTPAAEDRQGLLRSLLEGRAGAATIDLLGSLVGGHWSRPGGLLDAVEQVGVDALLDSAEQRGELHLVEDELFRFGRIVGGDRELSAVLGDVTVDESRRLELLRSLLAVKARPVTTRLAEVALTGFGGRTFAGSLSRLVELVARRRERTVAYVTTATPLLEDQEDRLAAALAGRYGQEVSLKVDVDPQVIGGIMVRIGADLYDGTVRHRLAKARSAMAR